MKPSGTLALCIPAYNAEQYLPHLLESALSQLVPFNEILVYNDCSTDKTKQIAQDYGARVIDGDKNRGCSFGKNKLAEVANSEWVHFHDADDLLLPNFTQVASRWIETNNKAAIVLLNFEYKDFATGELLGTPSYDLKMMEEDPVKFTITHKIVNFGLYKRNLFLDVGGFNLDPKVLYNEDAAFHQRLSLNGLTFAFEPEITCINYRYNKSMSVSNADKCYLAAYYVNETLISHGLDKKYPNEIAFNYWTLATFFASVQNWEFTKKAIKMAVSITRSKIPRHEKNSVLKYLCSFDPFLAFYTRGAYTRLFKSAYR